MSLGLLRCNETRTQAVADGGHELTAGRTAARAGWERRALGHLRWCAFYDDISGAPLDHALATAARKTEIEVFKARGVYTKVLQ